MRVGGEGGDYTPTTTDADFPGYRVCLGAEFADQRRKPLESYGVFLAPNAD